MKNRALCASFAVGLATSVFAGSPIERVAPFVVMNDIGEIWGLVKTDDSSEFVPELLQPLGFRHDLQMGDSVFEGDFNGDGLMDIGHLKHNAELWVAMNNGDLSFTVTKLFDEFVDVPLGVVEAGVPPLIMQVVTGPMTCDDFDDILLRTEAKSFVLMAPNLDGTIQRPVATNIENRGTNTSFAVAGYGLPGDFELFQDSYSTEGTDRTADCDMIANGVFSPRDLQPLTSVGPAPLFFRPTSVIPFSYYHRDVDTIFQRPLGLRHGGSPRYEMISPALGTFYGLSYLDEYNGFRDGEPFPDISLEELGRSEIIFSADLNGDGEPSLLNLTEFGDIWESKPFGTSQGVFFDGPPERVGFFGFRHDQQGPWRLLVGDVYNPES